MLPTVLDIIGLWAGSDTTMLLALIWLFHIGLDRVAGYGLKCPEQFGHTHLDVKGRAGPTDAALVRP